MKTKHIFFLAALIAFALWGCSKSDDSSSSTPDYPSVASGTYTGQFEGTLNATVVISKDSDTSVYMRLKVAGFDTIKYHKIGVVGSDAKIILKPNGDDIFPFMGGTVTGKTLDCTFLAHFVGTKP
jgi:hypothetical protein